MRKLPDCAVRKKAPFSMWISREFQEDPGIELLEDPDRLLDLPQCEIVKDQKKIKVGRVMLGLGVELREIYIKRYNPFSWRHRIGSLFVSSATGPRTSALRIDSSLPSAPITCSLHLATQTLRFFPRWKR